MRRILRIWKNKTCRLLLGIFKKQPAFFGLDAYLCCRHAAKKAACTLENRGAGCFLLFNEISRHGVSDTAALCSAGCLRVGNRIRQPALFGGFMPDTNRPCVAPLPRICPIRPPAQSAQSLCPDCRWPFRARKSGRAAPAHRCRGRVPA